MENLAFVDLKSQNKDFLLSDQAKTNAFYTLKPKEDESLKEQEGDTQNQDTITITNSEKNYETGIDDEFGADYINKGVRFYDQTKEE